MAEKTAAPSADVQSLPAEVIERMRAAGKAGYLDTGNPAWDILCDMALRSMQHGTERRIDAWKLYRDVFRELFPSPSVKPDDIVSPAVLQEMVDRLAPSASGSYEQVGWAKLGTMDGKLYVQSTRNMREGQTEYHFHPIFVRTADSGAKP